MECVNINDKMKMVHKDVCRHDRGLPGACSDQLTNLSATSRAPALSSSLSLSQQIRDITFMFQNLLYQRSIICTHGLHNRHEMKGGLGKI